MVELAKTLTLARFLREVYAPAVLPAYAPAWRMTAERHIDQLAHSSLGGCLFSELTPLKVAKWWSAQVGSGRSRQANLLRQRLRHACRYAIKMQACTSDPTKHLQRMRENADRVRYLSDEQRSLLLREAARTNPRIHRYMLVALHTLGRRRSLMNLRERDVDLARGVLVFRKTKTGKDVEVPLAPESFRATVAGWLTGKPDAFLLHQYATPEALSGAFRRVRIRAGIDDFTFHDQRHDLATRLVNAGTDLIVLKSLGGWKTMSMVARYAHPSEQAKRSALEQAFRSGSTL